MSFASCSSLSLLAALLLAACAADEPPAGPPVDLEVELESSALANGLEVVVVPNHTAPVVMALLSVRTGAFSETRELSGYSHLFEHMIFKGSEQLADPIEFRARLEALGAVANATTSVDQVNYFFTTAREHGEAALGLYAQALMHPAFDATELEKEKQVVLAEFDLDESDSEYEAYRRMLRELYGDQAYRLDALGAREVVEAVTSEELRTAHARWYVPDNALLVLSGDLTPAEGKEWATEHFGSWQKKPPSMPALPALPALTSSRRAVLEADISETVIRVAWPLPGATDDAHEAGAAASLLAALTDQRDHPFRRLVDTELASNAWLAVTQYRGAGHVVAELHVPFGHEALVLDELRRIVAVLDDSSSFRDSDLREAQDVIWRRHYQGLVDPLSLPFWVAGDWLDSGMASLVVGDIYEVGREAIVQLVREHLQESPRVTVLLSSPDNLADQGIDEAWIGAFE
jgi:zinc protease